MGRLFGLVEWWLVGRLAWTERSDGHIVRVGWFGWVNSS